MKRLEVITVIKECSDCPYSNIFGLFCNKYKRNLSKMDKCGKYIIPEWCKLDELLEAKEYVPELIVCDFISGHCIGASCICTDHESAAINKDTGELRFKCKNYGIWIVRGNK